MQLAIMANHFYEETHHAQQSARNVREFWKFIYCYASRDLVTSIMFAVLRYYLEYLLRNLFFDKEFDN